MREIKFRAWDIYAKTMLSWNELGEADQAMNLSLFNTLIGEVKHIIPMQFTGLRDKSGREIYEGDIVLHVGPFHKKDEGPELAKVIWKDAGFSFWGLTQPRGYQESYCPSSALYCEVIGNIYENPELLEGDGGRK